MNNGFCPENPQIRENDGFTESWENHYENCEDWSDLEEMVASFEYEAIALKVEVGEWHGQTEAYYILPSNWVPDFEIDPF